MSNSVSFVGSLGKDAELKKVGDSTVLEFNVANNVGFGEKKSTNWFKCAMWGKSGEKLEQFLKKGSKVFITGELTLREWQSKEGKGGSSMEVRVRNLDLVGSKADGAPAGKKESDDDMPF